MCKGQKQPYSLSHKGCMKIDRANWLVLYCAENIEGENIIPGMKFTP